MLVMRGSFGDWLSGWRIKRSGLSSTFNLFFGQILVPFKFSLLYLHLCAVTHSISISFISQGCWPSTKEFPWEPSKAMPGHHSSQNTWTGFNAPCHPLLQHLLSQSFPGCLALLFALSLVRNQRGSTRSRRRRKSWMERRLDMVFLAQSLKQGLLHLLRSSRCLP